MQICKVKVFRFRRQIRVKMEYRTFDTATTEILSADIYNQHLKNARSNVKETRCSFGCMRGKLRIFLTPDLVFTVNARGDLDTLCRDRTQLKKLIVSTFGRLGTV